MLEMHPPKDPFEHELLKIRSDVSTLQHIMAEQVKRADKAHIKKIHDLEASLQQIKEAIHDALHNLHNLRFIQERKGS
jgi:hypothetical protein